MRYDVDTVIHYLKKLPLFNEKMDDLKEKSGLSGILNSLAQNLGYRKLDKDDTIIEYGTKGNEFYIIIQGTVSVYVPQIITSIKTSTPGIQAIII